MPDLRIVDVGTGTGLWVIEVAEEFPTTMVYGIDLSPIQQTSIPSNAQFRVMDLNEGLGFDDGSTDLVHSRYETVCTSSTDTDLYTLELRYPNGRRT
jgi:ubiquinone/menaquinone biosynthesis C-methylase UbiE